MAVTWNVVALDATKTLGSLSDVVTAVTQSAPNAALAHAIALSFVISA